MIAETSPDDGSQVFVRLRGSTRPGSDKPLAPSAVDHRCSPLLA